MDTFNKLTELFHKFPGIGPRQAKRFVYFLLSRDRVFLNEITALIGDLREHIVECHSCFRFFEKRARQTLCGVCADPHRGAAELMIVAKDTDVDALEKSGDFHGRYFVLGGSVHLLQQSSARLRWKELERTVEQRAKEGLKEIILALNANPDGEQTEFELRRRLSPIASPTGVKISALGRGLSTGSELEYADTETLKSALRNRTA